MGVRWSVEKMLAKQKAWTANECRNIIFLDIISFLILL